jgi:hypothetical protein
MAMIRTWRKEARKNGRGETFWRLVSGSAEKRIRVNIGRVSEAMAEEARVQMEREELRGLRATQLPLFPTRSRVRVVLTLTGESDDPHGLYRRLVASFGRALKRGLGKTRETILDDTHHVLSTEDGQWSADILMNAQEKL